MELFTAEAPGPSNDKLHPRITDTAKRLWLIYVGYTLAETILLKVAGMTLFDAVNHSMSTMASGGFSTKNESLAYWNHRPVIQYIVTLFMFLAGTNFVLIYFGLKGKLQRIWQDNEFRWYIGFVIFFTLTPIQCVSHLISANLFMKHLKKCMDMTLKVKIWVIGLRLQHGIKGVTQYHEASRMKMQWEQMVKQSLGFSKVSSFPHPMNNLFITPEPIKC